MAIVHDGDALKAGFGSVTSFPILVVALGTLLSILYRNPLLLNDPQMFSEDIFVYFNENRLFGASALIEPYAGYLQLCCRIIAYIVGFFPARYAADLYALSFVTVIFVTAAVIYESPLFTGWGKVLAALTLTCSPNGSEVLFGMPYTQWIMASVVALALCESPTAKWRATILLGYFAMVGLSSPFVILAVPFVAWKTATERSRYAYMLCAVTVLCLLVQMQGVIHRSAANTAAGSAIERAFAATSIFYSWFAGAGYPGHRVAFAVAIPTAAFAIWYFWQNRRIAYRPFVYFIVYGGVSLLAGSQQVDANLHANQFFFGARYFYPTVVLCVLAFIMIEQSSGRGAVTLPLIGAFLIATYLAHVRPISGHITNRTWRETAECVERRTDCVTLMNPGETGYVRVPSDSELKTMSPSDRIEFAARQRWM